MAMVSYADKTTCALLANTRLIQIASKTFSSVTWYDISILKCAFQLYGFTDDLKCVNAKTVMSFDFNDIVTHFGITVIAYFWFTRDL